MYVYVGHLRPHQAIIWSWKPSNGWQSKTTYSGYTSPEQPPQTTMLTLYKLQVAQKRYTRFVAILESTSAFLTLKIGSRSPLKRLSESQDEAAVLEPVSSACLLPLAAPGAQGSQNGSQVVLEIQKPFLEHQSKTTASNHTADSTSSRWHKNDTLAL